MKSRYLRLPLLTAAALFISSQASADYSSFPGITFDESSGNINLTGKCFGNLSTCSTAIPTGGDYSAFFSGKASAKGGNLFFSGPVNQQTSLPSVSTPFVKWYNVAEAVGNADVPSSASLYVRGSCINSGGCTNTVYEPSKWNDSYHQSHNNCYNYGNDTITNTYAQPGYKTGHQVPGNYTCANVNTAVQWDGLTNVGTSFPGNGYSCGSGHLIFLAVTPDGWDFHWFRLDQIDGTWSQKNATGPARNWDDNGNPICNPLNANRGAYTTACYFYCNCGGKAQIYGPWSP